MFNRSHTIAKTDPELYAAIVAENNRQEDHIELIASENIVSNAVLEAQGSVLTNKYAEGYPGKRYYSGCEHVDVSENLAIERAKKLFDCNFARFLRIWNNTLKSDLKHTVFEGSIVHYNVICKSEFPIELTI